MVGFISNYFWRHTSDTIRAHTACNQNTVTLPKHVTLLQMDSQSGRLARKPSKEYHSVGSRWVYRRDNKCRDSCFCFDFRIVKHESVGQTLLSDSIFVHTELLKRSASIKKRSTYSFRSSLQFLSKFATNFQEFCRQKFLWGLQKKCNSFGRWTMMMEGRTVTNRQSSTFSGVSSTECLKLLYNGNNQKWSSSSASIQQPFLFQKRLSDDYSAFCYSYCTGPIFPPTWGDW